MFTINRQEEQHNIFGAQNDYTICLSKRFTSIYIELLITNEQTCNYKNFVLSLEQKIVADNPMKNYDTPNSFRKSAKFFRRRSMLPQNDDGQIYQYVLQKTNLP